MNSALMFSKASDLWETPQETFDELHNEFSFAVDAAASPDNAKCRIWFGPGGLCPDALALRDWRPDVARAIWLNPPYSQCSGFVAKAAYEAREHGNTVVALIPSRTDTRYWHEHIWDRERHQPRPGVEVRFQKGRLKFGFHVTDEIRAAVNEFSGGPEKTAAKALGLPLLVVRGIRAGDVDLIVGAPFPSVVVVFRPTAK